MAALQEFRPSYKHAAPQQGTLAIVWFFVQRRSRCADAGLDLAHRRLLGGSGRALCSLFHHADEPRTSKRREFRSRISEIAPCKVGAPSRGTHNLEPARFPFVGLGNRCATLIFRYRDLRLTYPVQ